MTQTLCSRLHLIHEFWFPLSQVQPRKPCDAGALRGDTGQRELLRPGGQPGRPEAVSYLVSVGEVNQARTQNRLEVLLKTLCGWLKEPTRCRNVRSWHFVSWGNHFFSVIYLVGLFNLPVYFSVFYVNVHDEMFVSELSVRQTESLWFL